MRRWLRALGRDVGDGPVLGEQVRSSGIDKAVILYGVLWTIYIVTQFRMPWTPLTYSEEAPTGGIRQIFFTLGVMFAMRRLIYTNTTSQILGMHMGGLLLGILLVSSVLWSTDKVLTIKRSMVYVFGYLMIIALVHVPRWPLRYYMKVIVNTMGWIAWVSIIAHFVFPKNCTVLSIRPGLAGLTVHPNVFGPCLEMAWGIGLGMPTLSRFEKAHKYFMMTGLIVALLMSNSVTALIATVIATGLYVIFTTNSYKSGAIILTGLAAGAVVQFIGVKNLKSFFFELVGRDESMSGRDTLWSDVFNAGMLSPVFGSGYGAFWYEGRGRELTGTWNPRQAHNAYIDVFVDIGVLGLILVLLVVHYKLITTWQNHAGERGTRQRNAVGAFVSMGIGLCFVGAFGESFLLKLDKFQFFCLFWGIMVFENYDRNNVTAEFAWLDREYPEVQKSKKRQLIKKQHGPPIPVSVAPEAAGAMPRTP